MTGRRPDNFGFLNELKRPKIRFLAPKASAIFGDMKIINYTPLVYYNLETRGGIVNNNSIDVLHVFGPVYKVNGTADSNK